jgi:hypothetical protein
MQPFVDGLLRCSAFPGLWLDPAALISRDKATVNAVLQKGIASAEHTEFVARLEHAQLS